MTPPPDHAGLARLARILQANRASTDWDTDSLAVAGIGRITLIDTGAARAIDSTGREITTVDGPDPDTALRGLIDLLARLAGADEGKVKAQADCTTPTPTEQLCARIAEASRAIAADLTVCLATCQAAALMQNQPWGRIFVGGHYVSLARHNEEEFEAISFLCGAMPFGSAIGTTAEEALTRLRDTLAQEATR